MNNKNKNSFARSAALMGIIILASKLLGLLRDILIAEAYGSTVAATAYETASKLPVTIFDFVLGGVVTSAFIPVYNNISVKRGKSDAMGFAQSYFNLIVVITALITVIGEIFAPALVSLIAPELVWSTASLAVSLTKIMFPMIIFVGIAFSFVGFLQSEGEYNIPAVISLVSNLIMVGYLLIFNDRFGVFGLSVAMLIGWIAQAAVQIPAVFKKGFRPSIKASLATPDIIRALKNSVPILVATWTVPLCSLINTRLASGLDEGRAINALGYSYRLYIIIVGLFSFVATNLIFPRIAIAAAQGKSSEGDRLTRSSIKTLIFIIAPISVGVAVLAEPFISLVYERGTFTPYDTLITAEALRFYAVGMMFQAVSEVLTKAFFAVEKNRLPMLASLISMAFNVLVVILVGDKLGIGGIALITSLSSAANMLVNLIFAYKNKLISPVAGDYVNIIKACVSALIMGVAVILVNNAASALPTVLSFAASVAAGCIVYALVSLILKCHEANAIINAAKKYDRR